MDESRIEADPTSQGSFIASTGVDAANNLPTFLTTFVGRRRELDELSALVSTTRLLMLTGTGGCGKTRLAAQLGRDVLARYPDGVWWLELAPISDPELVDVALASAIGVRPLPGRTPLEAATDHLASDRALLVVDNCEHLLDPVRRAVAELLRSCPHLTIVATSREPLGLGGEATWRVPSLSLSLSTSGSFSDAVRLFTERATKVRPDFALTEQSVPIVDRICSALGGIPLAIELAAVRVRVLSLDDIAAALTDRFRLLTGGDHGSLPRLQTLRASVDWSYELLDQTERVLLRRCGVFSGGFTLDTCQAVCAGVDLDRSELLDLVTSLVDKSLLLVEDRRSTRYAMLETIRQYALERLVEADELDATLDRHAETFLALAEDTAPTLGTDVDAHDLLATEAANLYAAIDHLARVAPERSLRGCIALAYWWLLTGRLVEGPAALTRAINAVGDLHSTLRGVALFWRGYLGFYAGDYGQTRVDEGDAMALARELGDKTTEARALNALGLLEAQSDPRASLTMLDRACELARDADDLWCLAEATQNVGWSLVQMGRFADARVALDASFEIADPHGWRELVAWHWLMVGHTLLPTGDLAAARTCFERGLGAASDVQEGFGIWSVGLVDVETGNAADALEQLVRGRARMVVSGAGLGVQFTDSAVGLAHAAIGDLDAARELLRTAADEHAKAFVWAEAMTRIDLAHVERLRGDHAAARGNADTALGIAEHVGNVDLAAQARLQLAAAAADREEWSDADELAHRALGDQADGGNRIDVVESLEMLARVESGTGRPDKAVRLLAAARRTRAELGLVRWLPDEVRIEELRLQLRAALGPDEFAARWSDGDALTIDDAIDYARRARGTRRRPSHGWGSLTPTELAVVRHVAAGLTNPEIAERMFISRGTVKVHLSHVYAKVGLRNRSEVAAEAIRRNLLDGA